MKQILAIALLIFFAGCAKDEILLSSYSAPKEQAKLKDLFVAKDNKFLSLAINPTVQSTQKDVGNLKNVLLTDLKDAILETNFINIHPFFDESSVGLSLSIVDYNYKQTDTNIDAYLSVGVSISKNATNIFSKIYNDYDKRVGTRQTLPQKNMVLASLSKRIVKRFVKDISPLKTKKLVELKPLPQELSHTINYAKAGNFKSAIKDMEGYKGKKELNFYYNLAIYYEGLAAQNQSLAALENANFNYQEAIKNGGANDKLVLKEKGKFDKFYELFSNIKKQKEINKKEQERIDEEYGM